MDWLAAEGVDIPHVAPAADDGAATRGEQNSAATAERSMERDGNDSRAINLLP